MAYYYRHLHEDEGLELNRCIYNNMADKDKPKITKNKGKPYTKITYYPDFERFGHSSLEDDMIRLITKRTYDAAAVTDPNVSIFLNEKKLDFKSFEKYTELYLGDKQEVPRIYQEFSSRWALCVAVNPNQQFEQVSFVNGITTHQGGKHVEYILNQIVKKISEWIKKKKKIVVKPMTIKEQLMLFVNCSVENPSFDSQTKDFMNTPIGKFGSTCSVSEKFIEKIAKLGVMETAVSLTEIKKTVDAKKSDGSKTKSIRGIPKLIDANLAGTKDSAQCTLILCEGDSAKAGIVSGLSKEDRNIFGVYPLKGKLINVRGENPVKVAENNEIAEIKKIKET